MANEQEIKELAKDLDCGENCPAGMTPDVSCNMCHAERLIKKGYRKPAATDEELVEQWAKQIELIMYPDWYPAEVRKEASERVARQLLPDLQAEREKVVDEVLAKVIETYSGVRWLYNQPKWEQMKQELMKEVGEK